MTRIDASASNQAKTGGILGYALTGGIASMSVKASIPGDTARNRADSTKPVFYMFFDESNPDSARQVNTFASGSAASVSSPNEMTLIGLAKKKGRREARVGSLNIGGAKTGVMDKDQIAFDYDMIRPGVLKVTPKTTLTSGEYGFIYAISGGAAGGALTARMIDRRRREAISPPSSRSGQTVLSCAYGSLALRRAGSPPPWHNTKIH